MQHECKITVIDKKCFTDYQEQYLADPNSALRFIYEMTRTGYDIFDILPDGIPLRISAS